MFFLRHTDLQKGVAQGTVGGMERYDRHHEELTQKLGSRMKQRREVRIWWG